MGDDTINEYDIRTIKQLFFDRQCGGSRRANQAVDKLVEGYRAAFHYLNTVLPTTAQREIEAECADELLITPEQMKKQLCMLLNSVHHDDRSREKFREAATEMGIAIRYEPGFDRQDCETDFRSQLADVLASHYATNIMIERAVARGGK